MPALIATLLWLSVVATTPPAPAPPAAPAPATLSVVAWDAAGAAAAVDVEVDGRALRTPSTILVTPGSHRLVVVRDGARRELGPVVARAGAFVDALIDLGVAADDVRLTLATDGADATDATDGADRVDGVDAPTEAPTDAPTKARAPSPPLDGGDGRVSVFVRSLVDDAALAGARVHLRGGGEVGVVDDAGRLTFTAPAGAHALSVVRAGHAPRIVDVEVVAGAERVVEIALLPLADELDELTVRAPQLRGGLAGAASERRAQKQLVEVLGSEQMKKAGDSDAAQALRRVTGLTVIGGRFVYVRGLGDRYSSTLVNGATLPSPEPERRVVPLDLFPSAVLEGLVVQKTWSPDLPGEFGGGSVQLRTRSDPRAGADKPLLSFGLSTGALLGATLTRQASPPAGLLDALAIDDGRRAVPADVIAASRDAPIAEGNALTGGGLSRKELEYLGESFSTAWSPRPAQLLPALGANAAIGDTFATPLGSLGAVAALTWGTDTTKTTTTRQLLAGSADALVVTDDLQVAATERSVAWSGILGLTLQPGEGQRLTATTLWNRAADDEARVVEGHDDDSDARLRLVRLRYVARQLFVQQLAGAHALPWSPWTEQLQLDWRASYALAARDEPGQRLARYDEDADGRLLLSARSDGNQVLTSSLVDHVVDAGVAVRAPFAQWTGEPAAVSLGVALSGKLREVDTRRFKFLAVGERANDVGLRARSIDEILTPVNIGADGFQLAESTRNTDNHTGSATVVAAFATGELPLWPDLVLSGGVRIEASRLQVTTFELFNAAAAPVVAELVNVDALPSVGLSWTFLDDVTLKTAVSRTVVRPELRELSPALYTDVAGSRARTGNPALQETTLSHVDARIEWAWSPSDGLSLAAFAKHFDHPIESVVTSGSDQALMPANVDAAFNAGLELEGRVSMATLVPTWAGVPVLGGLWWAGNGALIDSRVFIGPAQQGTLTSSERALEGQSPWVVNAQWGWDDDVRGSSVSLLYNVAGARIVEVGALGLPDAVEEPFHQVDLVLRQRLPGGFTFGAKAANLVDAPATRTLGGRTVESVVRGRAVSASLSWTW